MTGNNNNRTKGFTLIELIVAIGIFSIIITLVTGIFLQTLRAQRTVFAQQSAISNVRFALESMSRQMRVAKRAPDSSCIPEGNTFLVSGSEDMLTFINANNECVVLSLVSGTVNYNNSAAGIDDALTSPSQIVVEKLRFYTVGQTNGDQKQPRVTISLGVRGVGNQVEEAVTFQAQTTVTARSLDLE